MIASHISVRAKLYAHLFPLLTLYVISKLLAVTMPTYTDRQRALRILEASSLPTKSIKRRIAFLTLLRRDVFASRYWKRPTTYRANRYIRTIGSLLDSGGREFNIMFRMSHPEVLCLIQYFARDIVFQQQGGRKARPSKTSLGTIYPLTNTWI